MRRGQRRSTVPLARTCRTPDARHPRCRTSGSRRPFAGRRGRRGGGAARGGERGGGGVARRARPRCRRAEPRTGVADLARPGDRRGPGAAAPEASRASSLDRRSSRSPSGKSGSAKQRSTSAISMMRRGVCERAASSTARAQRSTCEVMRPRGAFPANRAASAASSAVASRGIGGVGKERGDVQVVQKAQETARQLQQIHPAIRGFAPRPRRADATSRSSTASARRKSRPRSATPSTSATPGAGQPLAPHVGEDLIQQRKRVAYRPGGLTRQKLHGIRRRLRRSRCPESCRGARPAPWSAAA